MPSSSCWEWFAWSAHSNVSSKPAGYMRCIQRVTHYHTNLYLCTFHIVCVRLDKGTPHEECPQKWTTTSGSILTRNFPEQLVQHPSQGLICEPLHGVCRSFHVEGTAVGAKNSKHTASERSAAGSSFPGNCVTCGKTHAIGDTKPRIFSIFAIDGNGRSGFHPE